MLKHKADARLHMLETNVRQKAYYEARFAGPVVQETVRQSDQQPNLPTRAWYSVRSRLQEWRYASGVNDYVYAQHRAWMSDLEQARVLDLGCSRGNYLSLWIAEHCAEYIGIDLSEPAAAYLDRRLRERGLANAHAYAQDLLANSFPDEHFDVVYAQSVLHHFKNKAVMLQELQRLLKPGGVVIAIDPLMTEPLNRIARTLYRPFQSDRAWEWPFSYSTFSLLQHYFEIAEMQGFMGMTKFGLPFYLLPGLGGVGRAIGNWGNGFDATYARRPGIPFFLCWMATLRLRKREKL